MQTMDEKKRLKILTTAAELFAKQPFHKVLLSDVAKAAGVGKGTVYTYFKSKEDLYLSIGYSGFSRLIGRIHDLVDKGTLDPAENLYAAIREMIHFAYQNPHLFMVMRNTPGNVAIDRAIWGERRRELEKLLASIIRQGVSRGVFFDPDPELSGRYIPGLIRSALLEGAENMDREVLTGHLLRFVRLALTKKEE
jgi:AcrR family transcriptional regulator